MTLSYAQAVHGRNGLDPMLLEARCNLPKQPPTAPSIRCDLAAEAALGHVIASQSRQHKIHPTKGQPGETLPEGFSRNYAGFLLRESKKEIEVNEETVLAEAARLKNVMIIACFVGARPPWEDFQLWLAALNG